MAGSILGFAGRDKQQIAMYRVRVFSFVCKDAILYSNFKLLVAGHTVRLASELRMFRFQERGPCIIGLHDANAIAWS
jgi:hypothetical protein